MCFPATPPMFSEEGRGGGYWVLATAVVGMVVLAVVSWSGISSVEKEEEVWCVVGREAESERVRGVSGVIPP